MTRAGVVLLAAVIAATTGCATRREGSRAYPQWSVERRSRTAECLRVHAFGKRSVKQGAGFVLRLSGRSQTVCRARVSRAQLQVGDRRYDAKGFSSEAYSLDSSSELYVYVPVEFDNQEHWNAGETTGRLDVWVHAGEGAPERLSFSMEQVIPEREP